MPEDHSGSVESWKAKACYKPLVEYSELSRYWSGNKHAGTVVPGTVDAID
jgi:hypothetical protein